MEKTEDIRNLGETMTSAMVLIRKKFRSCIRESIQGCDLSQNELEVLLYLSTHPENTAKDLSSCRGVSRSLVSKSVDMLMKRGYIRVEQDQQDRRKIRLFLEPKADGLVQKMQTAKQNFIRQVFEGISSQEMAGLTVILQKMMDNLQNDHPTFRTEENK